MVRTGLKAPAFDLPSSEGKSVRLQDFRGRNVVLYFYPRSTFVIDEEGVVRKVFPRVKVGGHEEKVLEALAAL